MDYLHDVADDHDTDFTTVLHDFQHRGCEALDMTHSTNSDLRGMAAMSDALFDLLGDDVDGVAAVLEDIGMGY